MLKNIFYARSMTLVCATLVCSILEAQDNHYENNVLGPRNAALANSGLARFEDQTAVFTNPATLSEALGSSFNFNAITGGVSRIRFNNGLGQGISLRTGGFNMLPNMAAGVLKPKKSEKDFVVGYAIYHKYNDHVLLTDRRETTEYNIINETESPGNEYYSGQYHLDKDLDEVNMVLGLGWSLSDKVNIGISQTFGYHSESYREYFNAICTPLSTSTGATVDVVSAREDVFLTYWKGFTQTMLGLTWKAGKWDVGLVVQTPVIGVMGKGQMMGDVGITNVRINKDVNTPRFSVRGNGYYSKLKATYKTPWYVGLGVSRQFGKARWYGALKYYSAVKAYEVMNPGKVSFVLPPSPEADALTEGFLRVWGANRSTLNWSLATDWQISEKRNLMLSFSTNRHYQVPDSTQLGFSVPKKVYDLYMVSVGTKLNFTTSDWVVTLRYAFGKNDHVPQPYSFYQPTEAGLLGGKPGFGTLTGSILYLALNYTFKFAGKGK